MADNAHEIVITDRATTRRRRATRRGRGEGSITQRADGRWMGRVELPERDAVT